MVRTTRSPSRSESNAIFFFQAEVGMRYLTVTGVQTCALPILEHHVGQVEVDLEVVVAERVVLRRVEPLEQRGRRVAPVVAADLVDLVEQHDRVHRARLAEDRKSVV